MDKKAVFAHYSDVINNLIDTNSYWKVFFQNPYALDDNILGHVEDDIPNNIDICGGASRICIIDHDYDYVVKFDYSEDRHGSVCEREEEIYRAAANQGLATYFSEVEYIGEFTRTINFFPFYKVEQVTDWFSYDVEAIEDGIERLDPEAKRNITIHLNLYAYRRASKPHFADATQEEKETIASVHSPLSYKNRAVAETFMYYYGADEYCRFSNFLELENVNDLHCGNVGEIDGNFCLIDYGGYFDPDSCSDYDSEVDYSSSSSESA